MVRVQGEVGRVQGVVVSVWRVDVRGQRGALCMVHGAWCIVYVHGAWCRGQRAVGGVRRIAEG